MRTSITTALFSLALLALSGLGNACQKESPRDVPFQSGASQDDPEPEPEPDSPRNTAHPFTTVLKGPVSRHMFQVRWGHLDNDGLADLATANSGQPNDVYSVREGKLVLRWSSPESDPSQGVSWGDFDGDGDHDLAVANMGAPNRLYRNESGQLTLFWSDPKPSSCKDAAWADVDSDGDLDLLFACVGPNQLWLNDAGQLAQLVEIPGSFETDALLLVDLDEDGDLDLITPNSAGTPEPDQVQLWDGEAFGASRPIGPAERSSSVAWVRLGSAGTFALATAKPNDKDILTLLGPAAKSGWDWADPTASVPTQTVWQSDSADHGREVRSVDFDGDGDDEVLWGVEGEVRLMSWSNERQTLETLWVLPQQFLTEGIDVADANGDGNFDVAVGNRDPDDESGNGGGVPVQVYLHATHGQEKTLAAPREQSPGPETSDAPLTLDELELTPGSTFEVVLAPGQAPRCPSSTDCIADYLSLPSRVDFPNPPLRKRALEAQLDRIKDRLVERLSAPQTEEALTAVVRQQLGIDPLLEGLAERRRRVLVTRSWIEPKFLGFNLLFEDPLVGQWSAKLLLPTGDFPATVPALLGLHGHADGSAEFLQNQHGVAYLASGVAILVHDQRASEAGANENAAARALLEAGGSLMAVRIYETLVGLEFLRALRRIDGNRVGLIGHSGGSLQGLLVVRITDGFAAHINDGRAEYSSWDEGLIADESLPGLYPYSDALSRLESIATPSLRLSYGYPGGPTDVLDFLRRSMGYVPPLD